MIKEVKSRLVGEVFCFYFRRPEVTRECVEACLPHLLSQSARHPQEHALPHKPPQPVGLLLPGAQNSKQLFCARVLVCVLVCVCVVYDVTI